MTDYTAPPTFETLLAVWMAAVPTSNATEKWDREQNFRRWAAEHDIEPTGYVDEFDGLAAEMYNLRANSPEPMTPERWARIKRRFPQSARICREQVLEELDEK